MSAESEAYICYEEELNREIRDFAVSSTNQDVIQDAWELRSLLQCGEISIGTAERLLEKLRNREEEE